MMMRLFTLFTLLILASLSVAQTIRIGAPPYSPPFVLAVDNQGHFSGFDVDLISEICHRIATTCEFKPIVHQDEFAAILDNTIDLAIGNITITVARQAQFLFSLPYIASYAEGLVKQQSVLSTINDLSGKTIGVEEASVIEQMINEKYHGRAKIKSYRKLADLLIALSADEIDVAILDKATAETWYANSDNSYQLAGPPFPLGPGYGFVAAKDNVTLITAINKALLAMEADGTYLRIYKTYFGGAL